MAGPSANALQRHPGPRCIAKLQRGQPRIEAVLADQFRRLRDGDRFWYQNYLTPGLVRLVEAQTLATILRRNTEIGDEIGDDVFRVGIAPRDRGEPRP